MTDTQKRILVERLVNYQSVLEKQLTFSIGNAHYHKNKKTLSKRISRHTKLAKAIAVILEDVCPDGSYLDKKLKSKTK